MATEQIGTTSGFCGDCGKNHSLQENDARIHCRKLMELLEQEQRIDFFAPPQQADPRLRTTSLFGQNRGKMFGVMTCRAKDGSERVLRAFSGQYNGIWEVKGWAAPLFDIEVFNKIYADIEPRIKELGHAITATKEDPFYRDSLRHQRRQLSRRWMAEIHSLYTLRNFRGQKRSLTETFTSAGGIPTGTGDCCAPKLLNQAIREHLTPLGMAEFYWGRENASGTRQHGLFYPPCTSKCAPILGFLLCGLDG